MKHCFDELKYVNGQIICRGWAAPEHADHKLQIYVTDQKKREVSCEIIREKRPDIGKLFFEDANLDEYGFYIKCRYKKEEGELVIHLLAEGEHAEQEEVVISPRQLYCKYRRQTSLLGKLKRFYRAEDKENFWRMEKYFHYSEQDKQYAIWKEMHMPDKKELKLQKNHLFHEQPLISLVVPVYRPEFIHLKEMIESVKAQSYSNWELCMTYTRDEKEEVVAYLKEVVSSNRKIKLQLLKENEGIAANTNHALSLAGGSWIAFMDHDDLLSPNALYEYIRTINLQQADVIYCDEDKYDDETGIFFEPHFKSDFNPDLLRCNNYICHMVMVRRTLLEEVGFLNPAMDGAQDHDFLLRCSEKTDRFVHIPKILYSWRCHMGSTASNTASKGYAYQAGIGAITEHYHRKGIDVVVTPMKMPGWYHTRFCLKEQPLVSVIIPNMDHAEDLKRCIASLKKATYQKYEIIIIENNSKKEETFALYEALCKEDERIRVLTWQHPFNYASLHNFAVPFAKGEYLLLLNNDTELITEDLFESMLGYCMREDVGITGARLYYPNDTVQHAGVLVGVSDGADHVFLHTDKNDPGYMGRSIVSQDLSAVTAACMMIKKEVYQMVNGMEEAFTVAYNDVDLCLKVRNAGLYVVYDAFACMYHYESASRGYEESEEKKARFEKEKQLLRERWPRQMLGDPYYNKNLSLQHGYYKI